MTDNTSSKNRYFSELIQHWDTVANESFSNSSSYYHRYLERIYKYIIPSGLRILEIGCGKGELLASVNPKEGFGVDLSGEMIRQAKEKFPQLQFVRSTGEDVRLEGIFDVIILSDLLNNVWDVQEILAHIRQYCNDSTRIVINAYSRLWQPFLNLARKVGLAAPMLPQNWLTVDDLKNMLSLEDFDVVQSSSEIILPVKIPLASYLDTVGSITNSPVTFTGGSSSSSAVFDPSAVGTTDISVVQPSGFTAPSNRNTSITATVNAPGFTFADITVGKDLEDDLFPRLGAPAPSDLDVTITSSDPSLVLLSADRTVAGSESITLPVSAGSTFILTFYVQALSDTGSVPLTISAPGFTSATNTVTLASSGFYISTSSFTTTSLSPDRSVSITSAALRPDDSFSRTQLVRGGHTIDVVITSSDDTVGSITNSPVTFTGGSSSSSAVFDPSAVGTTDISVVQPSGFTAPSNRNTSITATVNAPGFTFADITVGKDLEDDLFPRLGAPAPSDLDVTITSSDPSLVLLSADRTVAGSESITLPVSAGSTFILTFYVQALSDTGSVPLTISAPGFTSATNTVTLASSGFYISTPDFTTTSLSPDRFSTQLSSHRRFACCALVVSAFPPSPPFSVNTW